MKNSKYIKTISSSNNEFRFEFTQFEFFNIYFSNINFKVDSGCPYTTIPIQRLNIPNDLAMYYKEKDIDILINNISHKISTGYTIEEAIVSERNKMFKISYGIERGGMKNPMPDILDKNSLMNCTAISFKHSLSNLI